MGLLFSNSTTTPIPDVGTVTSTIVVSGASSFLFDLDVQTFLTHTFSADLDVTLTSPHGTVIKLTTDNGTSFDNVFNGTVWNDNAGGGPVTDLPSRTPVLRHRWSLRATLAHSSAN